MRRGTQTQSISQHIDVVVHYLLTAPWVGMRAARHPGRAPEAEHAFNGGTRREHLFEPREDDGHDANAGCLCGHLDSASDDQEFSDGRLRSKVFISDPLGCRQGSAIVRERMSPPMPKVECSKRALPLRIPEQIGDHGAHSDRWTNAS